MGTDDAKLHYQQRTATAETAERRRRDPPRPLDHLPVRGLAKALGGATLFALTYDILRLIALRG